MMQSNIKRRSTQTFVKYMTAGKHTDIWKNPILVTKSRKADSCSRVINPNLIDAYGNKIIDQENRRL